MTQTLLIVDDNEDSLASLQGGFQRSGYEVLGARSGAEAIEIITSRDVDAVVTDLRMPDGDGMTVLSAALERSPVPPVIIITAHGTIESAVEALQTGAFTYLTKPVVLRDLRSQVEKAMEMMALRRENQVLRREVNSRLGFEGMIGETRELRELVEKIRAIADTRATVLIEGESGTGKELVARAIHKNSGRAKKPFIPIHCAALSESLMESELFGHEKGAFTGAVARRQGLFEMANGGTVFLDEVGEIPLATQVKLLRVLESREFLRVGGTDPVKVDVRVLTATNRVLSEEVEEGRFREDLYYRLNVVRLSIPPLRARAADIPVLIEHFLRVFEKEHGKPPVRLNQKVLNKLTQFPWPGNVRQLRNVLENIVLFSDGREVELEDLSPEILNAKSDQIAFPVGTPIDQVERVMIERTLVHADGNRTHAAELLGISRRTLLRKIKELGLDA